MQNTIIRIPIDKLIPHPENPNKMSKQTFEKLKRHIKQSHSPRCDRVAAGNYEPLIVRNHPEIEDNFQIINGHHRALALRQLGETFADCIIWNIDDDQARVFLATLNRLGGKDELSLKAELIKNLSEKFSSKELSKLLPDSKAAIERLKDITKLPPMPENEKAFLNTLVFFLNDEQIKIVDDALCLAPTPAVGGSKSEKLAYAITIISKEYLESKGV